MDVYGANEHLTTLDSVNERQDVSEIQQQRVNENLVYTVVNSVSVQL